MIKRTTGLFLAAILIFALFGCGGQDNEDQPGVISNPPSSSATSGSASYDTSSNSSETDLDKELTQLEIRFGRDGEAFTLELYDNETAREIARQVGTADWNLPIYNFDDFDGWEVMQYYDIPSRYDIPSNGERIEAQAIGEVYYSHPNRIMLFYGDAQLTGEYTPVGKIADTSALADAVTNNPTVEGWSNKIVSISAGE